MDSLDIKSGRRVFSLTGFAILLCIALTIALQYIGTLLFSRFLENAWLHKVIMMLPQYIIAMPLAALLIRNLPVFKIESRKMRAVQLGGILLICFAFFYAGNFIGSSLNVLIQSLTQTSMTNTISKYFIEAGIWPNLVFAALAAPVSEELFYRKLIIPRLLPFGEKPAILLSALLFGLAHGNLSQFFYAFGLGLVFGYVFVKTGKVRYSMILHVMMNLFGTVLSVWVLSAGVDFAMIFALTLPCLAIIGLVIFIINIKRIKASSGIFGIPKGKISAFLNPGTIMLYIGSAALFVVSAIGSMIPG